MKNEENKSYFENVRISLGCYKSPTYKSFKIDGKEVDFRSYVKSITGSRGTRMYIYTEKVTDDGFDEATGGIDPTETRQEVATQKNTQVDDLKGESQDQLPGQPKKLRFSNDSNSLNFTTIDEKLKIIRLYDNIENYERVQTLELSVPIIREEELLISSYGIIGQGAFGTIRKGVYNGTDVAVKVLRLTLNNKFILRELKVMDTIKHPNIISLMAVAVGYNNISIIMEHFVSHSLRHMLFDPLLDNLQNMLTTENKNYICLQICTAVMFLHSLHPPVFHKDLKTNNILVNDHFVTKICDMGSSRSDEMPLELVTEAGKTCNGTIAYTAPEILLHDESGKAPADIWALACIIIELYDEDDVWKVAGNRFDLKEAYSEILRVAQKPDFYNVPAVLRNIIESCFEHDASKRPTATMILNIAKGLKCKTT